MTYTEGYFVHELVQLVTRARSNIEPQRTEFGMLSSPSEAMTHIAKIIPKVLGLQFTDLDPTITAEVKIPSPGAHSLTLMLFRDGHWMRAVVDMEAQMLRYFDDLGKVNPTAKGAVQE